MAELMHPEWARRFYGMAVPYDVVRAASPPPIGPEVPVDDGSPSIELLVAFVGRDPHFSPEQ